MLRTRPGGRGFVDLAVALKRSTASVHRMRRKLRLGGAAAKPWSAEQLAALTKWYGVKPPGVLARELGRSIPAMKKKAAELGITTRSPAPQWTPAEDELLRRSYRRTRLADLARRLGRTPGGLRMRAFKLGLMLPKVRFAWSPESEAVLRDRVAAGWGNQEIADLIGCAIEQVRRRRIQLRLPRTHSMPRWRNLRARLTREWFAAGGASHWVAYRARAAGLAESYGLPGDLSPRAIQIVLLLAAGPKTRAELCQAIGIKSLGCWRPGRCTDYLADLARRGLVGSYQRDDYRNLYLLTADAMNRLATAGGD